MQELVNQDDLGRRTIPIPELPAAHSNDVRPRVCERHDGAGLALRRRAIVEEPQQGQSLGRTFPASEEFCFQALAGFVREVG